MMKKQILLASMILNMMGPTEHGTESGETQSQNTKHQAKAKETGKTETESRDSTAQAAASAGPASTPHGMYEVLMLEATTNHHVFEDFAQKVTKIISLQYLKNNTKAHTLAGVLAIMQSHIEFTIEGKVIPANIRHTKTKNKMIINFNNSLTSFSATEYLGDRKIQYSEYHLTPHAEDFLKQILSVNKNPKQTIEEKIKYNAHIENSVLIVPVDPDNDLFKHILS